MDIVDPATRSRMMAGIRSKDTKPEVRLRLALHRMGFRYRLHTAGIPGRPDIVLPKYHAVIFVHGCFWHRHDGCSLATTPSTRTEFWQRKFDGNTKRDRTVMQELLSTGWRAAVIWECALKRKSQVEESADQVARWLEGDHEILEVGVPASAEGTSSRGR